MPEATLELKGGPRKVFEGAEVGQTFTHRRTCIEAGFPGLIRRSR